LSIVPGTRRNVYGKRHDAFDSPVFQWYNCNINKRDEVLNESETGALKKVLEFKGGAVWHGI
jgi:hypothetical protein